MKKYRNILNINKYRFNTARQHRRAFRFSVGRRICQIHQLLVRSKTGARSYQHLVSITLLEHELFSGRVEWTSFTRCCFPRIAVGLQHWNPNNRKTLQPRLRLLSSYLSLSSSGPIIPKRVSRGTKITPFKRTMVVRRVNCFCPYPRHGH